MKRIFLILPLVFLLASCTEVYRYTRDEFYSMTTVVTVISDADTDFAETRQFASDFENRVSRTKTDSEIYKLNKDGKGTLSDDSLFILKKALEIAEDTEYAFNPCMGELADLWDITSGNKNIPSDEEISKALSTTNAKDVIIEEDNVTLPNGMKIDLGGVAKGYALEKMLNLECLKSDSPNVCVSIGGNVGVVGSSQTNRKNDISGWNIGITNPFEKQTTLGSITLEHGFISVSGAYERYFEKDGKIYHHIFDAKTGYPSKSDLASAVVINNDGLEGDALSTALFVMGKDKAIEFYKNSEYDFEMILITDGGEIVISEGVSSKFSPNESAKGIKGRLTVAK